MTKSCYNSTCTTQVHEVRTDEQKKTFTKDVEPLYDFYFPSRCRRRASPLNIPCSALRSTHHMRVHNHKAVGTAAVVLIVSELAKNWKLFPDPMMMEEDERPATRAGRSSGDGAAHEPKCSRRGSNEAGTVVAGNETGRRIG